MRVYGLTGGIASGKSTVAGMFRDLGARVIDADLLARDVVATGSEALAEIEANFGSNVLRKDGSLDRTALGAIVFADDAARQVLNSITHPRIAQAGQEAIHQLAAEGEELVLYEAALIVENGLHRGMHGLIVVSIPEELQLQRLQARDGLSLDEARARLSAQLPLAKKLAVADYVIDNSGTKAETREQTARLWAQLQRES